MSYDSNGGTSMLAKIIQKRMNEAADKPPALDFGEITGSHGLKTNNFAIEIPAGDYLVSDLYSGAVLKTHPGKTCDDETDERSRQLYTTFLNPGDRVLVAWVGSEAIVICRIFPAEKVKW